MPRGRVLRCIGPLKYHIYDLCIYIQVYLIIDCRDHYQYGHKSSVLKMPIIT